MPLPAPYIIDHIRRRERGQNRESGQVPLRIEVPQYNPTQDRYGRGQPPKEPERGIVEIDYTVRPMYERGGSRSAPHLEYRL